MSGVFIAFEGIDGSGKSTAARAVADNLRARGLDVVLTREPGGTEPGREIRAILLEGQNQLAPGTELLLMCADPRGACRDRDPTRAERRRDCDQRQVCRDRRARTRDMGSPWTCRP